MKKHFILSLVVAVFFACAGNEKKDTVSQALYSEGFTLPVIPDSIETKTEKGKYLAIHFWDNFNFADTASFSQKKIAEQAYVDFLNVLVNVDTTVSKVAIDTFTAKTSSVVVASDYFISLTEKYLYNPHSPLYAEELYILFLRSYIDNKNIEADKKIRPSMHLASTMKNRHGSRATDFTYTTANGKKAMMSSINSPLTIVYFNNPLCEECQNTLQDMKNSPFLDSMIKDKKLSILSMYVDDEPQMWKEHISDYPKTWIIAFDNGREIDGKELYSLRLIPSMYLLDVNKKVILKDAQWSTIKAFLEKKLK